MQAIETEYLPVTNFKSSRIKATCQRGSTTVSWDYALNSEGNHRKAVKALCEKLDWNYEFVTGWLPNGHAVHVFLD